MVHRRAARYTCNIHHNNGRVSAMLNTLNWPKLQEHRLLSPFVMMYKITNQLVTIASSTILVPSAQRTRKHHSLIFRHIYTTKDSYRFSFSPYTGYYSVELTTYCRCLFYLSRHLQLLPAVLCSLI